MVNFLLQTEIIPLCLRIMETGSELSKTVATFIVQKILLDEAGLDYICATAERFYAVSVHSWRGHLGFLTWAACGFISSLASCLVLILTVLPCDYVLFQVSTVLSGMVAKLLEGPSVRLLKHIVRCYLRLSEHPR